MKKLISTFIFLCVILLQAGFTNAAEVEILGISNETEDAIIGSEVENRNGELGSTLYRIDYKTGNSIPVGPIGYHNCLGLDFHSITGQLYATCLGDSHNPILLNIDPITGHGTQIVELQFQEKDFGMIADISFRDDGTLFAYIFAKDFSFLAILHPDTGIIENLGNVGLFGQGNAIAFNSVLYNAQTLKSPILNTMNQTNGAATFSKDLNVPPPVNGFPIFYSMDEDKADNVFYAVLDEVSLGYTFYLTTVDVNNGDVDIIGQTVDGIQALAVRRPIVRDVPTLSEYSMIALAVIFFASALLVLRRRKQSIEA